MYLPHDSVHYSGSNSFYSIVLQHSKLLDVGSFHKTNTHGMILQLRPSDWYSLSFFLIRILEIIQLSFNFSITLFYISISQSKRGLRNWTLVLLNLANSANICDFYFNNSLYLGRRDLLLEVYSHLIPALRQILS